MSIGNFKVPKETLHCSLLYPSSCTEGRGKTGVYYFKFSRPGTSTSLLVRSTKSYATAGGTLTQTHTTPPSVSVSESGHSHTDLPITPTPF